MSDNSYRVIERSSVWQSAAEQVRNLVRSGSLTAGQRLPGERELCQRFGISRISLREALRALEREGFIAVQAGKGAYVRPQGDRGQAVIEAFMLTEANSAEKVFELRRLFEPSLASLAAQKMDSVAIEVLAATVDELEASGSDGLRAIEADAAFHRALGEYSSNGLIEGLVHFVMRATGEERRLTLATERGIAKAARGHREILNHIAAHDADRAADAMRRHLDDAVRFSVGRRQSGTRQRPTHATKAG